jgi:hypothetical protein
MITEQESCPLHAPSQPMNDAPDPAACASITVDPAANVALQIPPQLIPAGSDVTEPGPDIETESVYVRAGAPDGAVEPAGVDDDGPQDRINAPVTTGISDGRAGLISFSAVGDALQTCPEDAAIKVPTTGEWRSLVRDSNGLTLCCLLLQALAQLSPCGAGWHADPSTPRLL